MEISKTAAGVIAGFCILAGAGGAYIASRGGDTPATASESVSSTDPALGVEQSEAVVGDAPATESAPPTSAPTVPVDTPAPPAVSRRAAPPARPQTAREPVARNDRTTRPVEPAPAAAPVKEAAPAIAEAPRAEPAPVRAPEPREPEFEELVVSADSVVGLQVETAVTSETARVEDEVVARVTRDVRVGDRVAIPAGATAKGEVTLVERGGRLKDRARLGIRFTSIVLADGTRVPIDTETIYREGDGPGGESAAKIGGGAIGGAILGGILGGAKGAILGGSAGAGAGSAAVLMGGRNPATLPAGAPVTVRVTKPVSVTVDK